MGYGTEMDAAIVGGVIGIAGAVVGALVAFGLERLAWLIYWLSTKPAIVVDFDDAEDCITTTPQEYGVGSFSDMQKGIRKTASRVVTFARIRVTNKRNRLVENCRAWLVAIDEKEGGKWKPTVFRDSTPLIWSYNAELESVAIPKGVIWHVDVAEFSTDRSSFTVALRAHDGKTLSIHRFKHLFERPCHYRLRILVSALDVAPKSIYLEFSWEAGKPPVFYGI